MFGRRTPPAQSTDSTGRVSPRASPRGSYAGTGAFDRAQPSPPASPRYSSAGGVGTGTTSTTGGAQQYGQATTGSSPRYAQQTTSTTSYSGTGTTGAGYSGATGAGKVLSNTTEAGRAEYPGIGGTLAPIQHAERHPLAASERQYGGVVCNRQYFTVTEDRTVLREEIQLVREHHPYEKEFIVESRPTGRERELPNTLPDDLLEASLREVDRSIPDVCEGAPVVTPANVTTSTTLQGQGIGAATTGTTATSSQYTSGTTTTGTTGTGYGATGTSGTGAGYGATSTTGSGYSGRR